MKEKQFRPLDIVISRRNLHEKLHSARAAKKRKGFQGVLVGKSTSDYHSHLVQKYGHQGFY